MSRGDLRATRAEVVSLSREGLDWVTYAARVTEIIGRVIPFERSCWHTVDPGTVLFTGSVNRNVGCSGTWLAEHEYAIDDVNKWWFLARSGRLAGATSLATHGDLSRSARYRSQANFGIGDELRGSFVAAGGYWGAAGFLRDRGASWFTPADVGFLAGLSEPIAEGLRRASLVAVSSAHVENRGPGVVVFDEDGGIDSISPAAEYWIEQMVELPPAETPSESKVVQGVAARARHRHTGADPLEASARARVPTRSGHWLLLYGTRLGGARAGCTAVIIQPAAPNEVAPLVALAYGLSEREMQITQLCLYGHSTEQMARSLYVSPYTVQDHLKSIFGKTGARTRGQLVGQIFLEHCVPSWRDINSCPQGWSGFEPPSGTAPSTSDP